MSIARALSFLAACGAVAGCGTQRSSSPPAVTVLAAASTVDAVTEVADSFRAATGREVRISAGPSNGLARQILSGAPADVFLSASAEWADSVVDADRAVDSRRLLSNRIVLVVPAGNRAGVRTPQDLQGDSVTRIALAGEGVPAGHYAGEALASLDLFEPLQAAGKIVRGHDVRLTLGFVERGEAEAGIVYATDAATTDRVEVVHAFDPEFHGPIEYPAVLLKDGPAGSAGRDFYEFLTSDEPTVIFRRHGFLPASAPETIP